MPENSANGRENRPKTSTFSMNEHKVRGGEPSFFLRRYFKLLWRGLETILSFSRFRVRSLAEETLFSSLFRPAHLFVNNRDKCQANKLHSLWSSPIHNSHPWKNGTIFPFLNLQLTTRTCSLTYYSTDKWTRITIVICIICEWADADTGGCLIVSSQSGWGQSRIFFIKFSYLSKRLS